MPLPHRNTQQYSKLLVHIQWQFEIIVNDFPTLYFSVAVHQLGTSVQNAQMNIETKNFEFFTFYFHIEMQFYI